MALLRTSTAAAQEAGGGATSAPAEEPPAEKAKAAGDDGYRFALAGQVGAEGSAMLRSGPSDGPPGFALGVSGTLAGLLHARRFVHYLVLDGSFGVGFAGVQGEFDGAYAIGLRLPVTTTRAVDHGPFLRAGISGLAIANNRTLVDVLDVPYGELGWSLVSRAVAFQLYARGGLAARARFSSGPRFEDLDARRDIDPALEGGVGGTLALGGHLFLDGRYVHVLAGDARGSDIDYATARACLGVASSVATCLRFAFATSEVRSVRDVPAGADPWSWATTTYVGLSVGVGLAGITRKE